MKLLENSKKLVGKWFGEVKIAGEEVKTFRANRDFSPALHEYCELQ
jgi:hypothetical protein